MRIIVNADDLGMSREVNEAIFASMARGEVTSATLLANGPEFNEALRGLPRFPGCSFGVHLNITQFEPLSETGRATLAATNGGTMSRSIQQAAPAPALLRAVYREWCAQVERVLSAGVAISHFDSHNHTHTLPWALPIVKFLQRRYGIRKVRATKNLYLASDLPPAGRLWKKRAYNWALRRAPRTVTTDRFTEFLTFCRFSQDELPPVETCELMVHPGAVSQAEETALLATGWRDGLRFKTVLINYNEL